MIFKLIADVSAEERKKGEKLMAKKVNLSIEDYIIIPYFILFAFD